MMRKLILALALLAPCLIAATIVGSSLITAKVASPPCSATYEGGITRQLGGSSEGPTDISVCSSDGAGSPAYSNLSVIPTHSYGELHEINESGTILNVTVPGTYVQWVSSTVGLSAGAPYVVASAATDNLIVGSAGAGVYEVAAHTSWAAGSDSPIIDINAFQNGSASSKCQTDKSTSSTDRNSTSFHCFMSLAATDTIDLRFTADKVQTLSLYHVNLTIIRIK